MAVKVELEVEISPDGEVRIKTRGLKGTECTDELKSFEKGLGPMKDVQKTSEYYEKATSVEKSRTSRK